MARVITYECDECGCNIVVSETPDTEMEPIYCCGSEVRKLSSATKKAVKKTAKKATPKKKSTAKKRTSKKSR